MDAAVLARMNTSLCKLGVEALTATRVQHPADALRPAVCPRGGLWPAAFLRVTDRGSRLRCMGMPETRYARSGDVSIAYQVLARARLTWSSCPAMSPTSS
jgi:hypothetical protein